MVADVDKILEEVRIVESGVSDVKGATVKIKTTLGDLSGVVEEIEGGCSSYKG